MHQERKKRPELMPALSPLQFEFFASKGQVFQDLWFRKMRKGLSRSEAIKFNQLVEQYEREQIGARHAESRTV